MDCGIDKLVYIIIGVIFVFVQVTRTRNIAKGKFRTTTLIVKDVIKEGLSAFRKEFLGINLAANQGADPIRFYPVPPVFGEPTDFHQNVQAHVEPLILTSSFNDPGQRADAGNYVPAKLPEVESSFSAFDLRSAVIYSVILERKYV